MPVTINTSTSSTATAYSNQRKLDRCQNGVLWALFNKGTNSNPGHFLYYSGDNGTTWIFSGAVGPANPISPSYTQNASFFIDLDDYAHFVVKSGQDGLIYYYRGTPNAGRTAWTWSAAHDIGLNGTGDRNYPDVVAHREGTGWVAHIVISHTETTTEHGAVYGRVVISSSGTLTNVGAVRIGGPYGNTVHTWPSIDFHHTGDGKTVAGGTPHLYVAWSAGATGAGKGIRFKKATYSGGVTNTSLVSNQRAGNGQVKLTLPDATTQTFNFTGGVQDYVVPAGVTQIQIECWGAQGGGVDGGKGGKAEGIITVTPGETLKVYVGGQGGTGGGGWNGGGNSGNTGDTSSRGGGGASDVRQGGTALANRKIVGGGGGGHAWGHGAGNNVGGYGGGTSGGIGGANITPVASPGTGGTQSAGGTLGGSLGQGGTGGAGATAGSGGGGGYYGGGGAAGTADPNYGAGGGGGSGFVQLPTWTWGTEREIDSARYVPNVNQWLNCLFDGTRVIMVGEIYDGAGFDLILYDRDAADTATVTSGRVLLDNSATASRLAFGSSTYDGDGNVYIFGTNQDEADGSKDLVYRKWTRATASLGAEVVVDTSANVPYVSAKRGYSNSRIEFIYTDGTSSPYNVTYDSIIIPGREYWGAAHI